MQDERDSWTDTLLWGAMIALGLVAVGLLFLAGNAGLILGR